MLKAMRVYKEIGYDGMMMPDHVPSIEGDAGNLRGSRSPSGTSRRSSPLFRRKRGRSVELAFRPACRADLKVGATSDGG